MQFLAPAVFYTHNFLKSSGCINIKPKVACQTGLLHALIECVYISRSVKSNDIQLPQSHETQINACKRDKSYNRQNNG